LTCGAEKARTPDGRWVPVPFVDPEAAEKIFRHKVMSFLMEEGLLSEERARILLSWRRSGFSVHTAVTVAVGDRTGLERLGRYLVRPPVSLERLDLDGDGTKATYQVKRSARAPNAGEQVTEELDPRDLLARILMHVAEPRAQLIRYYGEYSVAAQAKRKRDGRPLQYGRESSAEEVETQAETSTRAERRAQRRAWAQLIRRIHEVDPLLCDWEGAPSRAPRNALAAPCLIPDAFSVTFHHSRRLFRTTEDPNWNHVALEDTILDEVAPIVEIQNAIPPGHVYPQLETSP
jgi:hypothetical protein